ncbi:DUF2510 domain-containing protein [Pseudolysinimonas sp.]|uniref:DUF2510 domain-containing protein n=1 Tax=Pseudolysinimonas sp. TaxID=2680009 RepID=UPI003F7D3925
MTDQAIRVVGAGWYEDPADVGRVRWWNGVAWTEHTNPKPGLESGQVAAALTGSVAVVPTSTRTSAAVPEEPRAALPQLTRRQAIEAEGGRSASEPVRSQTGVVWLIALLPVIAFVLALGAGYVYFYVAPSPFVALILAVPYLLGLLWALSDSRQLRARGFAAPSPLWALLTPLGYLIARRLRVPGSAAVVIFAVTAVLGLIVPGVLFSTGAVRNVTLAIGIQREAQLRFVSTEILGSVSCPPVVESIAPGTVFACQATTTRGVPTQVWVSIDSADGAFSLARAV